MEPLLSKPQSPSFFSENKIIPPQSLRPMTHISLHSLKEHKSICGHNLNHPVKRDTPQHHVAPNNAPRLSALKSPSWHPQATPRKQPRVYPGRAFHDHLQCFRPRNDPPALRGETSSRHRTSAHRPQVQPYNRRTGHQYGRFVPGSEGQGCSTCALEISCSIGSCC